MTEKRRGCGFRKIGGLYLVGGKEGFSCAALPYPLDVCPHCSSGIKFSRGWTWLSRAFFQINELECFPSPTSNRPCPMMGACAFTGSHERLGLLWIGENFYKTPVEFSLEAEQMGISRRISTLPRGFTVGETWVALAHRKAVYRHRHVEYGPPPEGGEPRPASWEGNFTPGIFTAFRPKAIEFIVTEKMLEDPKIQERIQRQGLTPVVVPDIPQHRGSVHDKEPEE
jgi:hypothetical protein